MRKQYIIPQIEVLTLSGTAVMLGASGDLHATNPGEQSQSGNRIRKHIDGVPVF
jgi:hypothetical protein